MIKFIDYFGDLHLGIADKKDDSIRSRDIFMDLLFDTQDGTIIKKGGGDIFEGWQNSWNQIKNCKQNRNILEILKTIELLPGNHDDFLSKLCRVLNIRNTSYYIENNDVLVTHGHQFDKMRSMFSWSRYVVGFVGLLEKYINPDIDEEAESLLNKIGRIGKRNVMITPRTKGYAGDDSEYINGLVDLARKNNVKKVIWGHTHKPRISYFDDITLFNWGHFTNGKGSFVRYNVEEKTCELKIINWRYLKWKQK